MSKNDEDEEMTDEERTDERARQKRASAKMEKFMAEIGEELLSKRDYEALRKFIMNDLKGIGSTLPHLRAYEKGLRVGLKAEEHLGNSAPLLAGLRRMIVEDEAKVKGRVDKAMGG